MKTLDKYNLKCEECGFTIDPEHKVAEPSTFKRYTDYFDAIDELIGKGSFELDRKVEHRKADCINFLRERIEKLEAKLNSTEKK